MSRVTGLPRHRAIVALDIEQSTGRPDGVKAELRGELYEMFDKALRSGGITRRHRDCFIDRGDGILALIRPVDLVPKVLLLTSVMPALTRLLTDYDTSLPRARRPQRQLRVRAVVHAGEILYDDHGCFGEALDIAFRLLDARPVKKALRVAAEPLTLVISDETYRGIVRHGYDGIDQHTFLPQVTVQVAGHRHQGWIHVPRQPAGHTVTDMARYRQLVRPVPEIAVARESLPGVGQTLS